VAAKGITARNQIPKDTTARSVEGSDVETRYESPPRVRSSMLSSLRAKRRPSV
jgi:hypothetical protein